MADKKRIDEVGAYIAKYYVPDNDDIKLDKEMQIIMADEEFLLLKRGRNLVFPIPVLSG